MPTLECGLHRMDLFENVRAPPFSCVVVICDLPLLIELDECFRDDIEVSEHGKFMAWRRRGTFVEMLLQALGFGVTDLRHHSMIEHPGERGTLSDSFPILREFNAE